MPPGPARRIKMKGAILDIDGVLKRGNTPIDGAVESVNAMIDHGMKLMLLSNNSTRTRDQLIRSLKGMGFPEMAAVNSAHASAVYLAEESRAKSVLALGEDGLFEELRETGLDVTIAGKGMSIQGILKDEKKYDAVVVGMNRALGYNTIAHAVNAIRDGSPFVATNTDPTFPVEDGKVIPGAGSAVMPVSYCSGVKPVIVGKPNPYSTKLALEEMGLDPRDVMVIGDRADTDIEAGRSAGCQVARVLTGDVGIFDGEEYPVEKDLITLVKRHILD